MESAVSEDHIMGNNQKPQGNKDEVLDKDAEMRDSGKLDPKSGQDVADESNANENTQEDQAKQPEQRDGSEAQQ